MSDYTPATNFTAKDNLITGNPSKLIKGSEIQAELNALAAAIASKSDITYVDAQILIVNALIASTAFSTALPSQPGNAGKYVTTDGTNASWEAIDLSTLTAPTINGGTLNDATINGPSYSRDDDGTISGGTWPIDYANGPLIKATAGAAITSITISNWPASGTLGHLKLMLLPAGFSITFPTWTWTKSDLTTTTTFADLSLTLPSGSTPVFFDLFTIDGGTTVYAFVARN